MAGTLRAISPSQKKGGEDNRSHSVTNGIVAKGHRHQKKGGEENLSHSVTNYIFHITGRKKKAWLLVIDCVVPSRQHL